MPDPKDKRDLDHERLGLVSSSLPDKTTMRPAIRLHQGAASSCVGHAFAYALEILEASAGLSNKQLVSRNFMYYNSRKFHSGSFVTDTGTYLRTCAKGLQKLGVCDEDLWPYRQASVLINRRPSWASYMRAHARKGGQYVRIGGDGSERILAVKAALATGFPVVFGTTINRAFTLDNGPLVIDRPSKNEQYAGGHAMCMVGYKDKAGETDFEVVNSWGETWRDNGCAWLTEEYIRWYRTRDLWIVHGWDRVLQALAAKQVQA